MANHLRPGLWDTLYCCKYRCHCCVPAYLNFSDTEHCSMVTSDVSCWLRVGVCTTCQKVDCVQAIVSRGDTHKGCLGTFTELGQRVNPDGSISGRLSDNPISSYYSKSNSLHPNIRDRYLLTKATDYNQFIYDLVSHSKCDYRCHACEQLYHAFEIHMCPSSWCTWQIC